MTNGIPSKPIKAREPEGDYSTIRLADGTIETVLFGKDGEPLATRRTYISYVEIQRQHIREIRAELEGN